MLGNTVLFYLKSVDLTFNPILKAYLEHHIKYSLGCINPPSFFQPSFLLKNIIMLLTKEHLSGKYEWAASYKSLLFTGSPTRRLFDRWNGFQVLFIINCIAQALENFSIEDGMAIEKLIINGLPHNVQSELTVISWLRFNTAAV